MLLTYSLFSQRYLVSSTQSTPPAPPPLSTSLCARRSKDGPVETEISLPPLHPSDVNKQHKEFHELAPFSALVGSLVESTDAGRDSLSRSIALRRYFDTLLRDHGSSDLRAAMFIFSNKWTKKFKMSSSQVGDINKEVRQSKLNSRSF